MEKRLVTRYATKSPEAADENQRRIEGVFEDLAANRPGTVSYIVLRLADDSCAASWPGSCGRSCLPRPPSSTWVRGC